MLAHPWTLLALWFLPAAAGLLVYAQLKRSWAAQAFVDPVMAQRLMPPGGMMRAWLKGSLTVLGLGLLIVAAAQPRFGVYFEQVVQRGADIVILLDVSKSMLAQDVGQSRLDKAKSDIRELLKRLGRDRVGMVVFAGKPVVKSPLTTDHGFFLSVLERIDTDSAPRGGTRIGDGLRKCLALMPEGSDRDRVVVLITDGEDHESSPQEAAEDAGKQGVRILAVGLGDATDGARIPFEDASGERGYVKYDGQEVWSKLDGALLKDITDATQGAYIPAGTKVYNLGQFYEDHLAGLSRSEFREEERRQRKEQFQWFLFFGIALLVVELAIPAYPRPTALGTG
jgi:Ca-activated chloride channel family protein